MKTETNLHLLQQKSWQFYRRAILLVVIIDIIILTICFASFNTSAQSWRPLPGGSLDGDVLAITSFGGYTWVSGNFTNAGPLTTAQYIVRHDGYNWISADTLPSPAFGFCVYNNELYAFGGFNVDTTRYGMMKWTGNSWLPLGRISRSVGNSCMKSGTVFNGQLIVGGIFVSIEGASIQYLAKFDGTNWLGFSGSTQCSWQVQPTINDVYAANGYVYVSGSFNQLCGQNAFCSAKWNGISWSALNVAINTYTSKCISHAGSVYIAGCFANVGAVNAQAVARDGGANWQNVGNGAKIYGQAIASYNGRIYVAGQKNTGPGDPIGNCGYWNGSSWVSDNVGICATSYEIIATLYTDQTSGIMYAGGRFNTFTGSIADYIAYKGEISLPVELTSFTCGVEKSADCVVNLKWETATETNADHFCLSVSTDAFLWKEFGNVAANGNSTQLREYSFTHTPVNMNQSVDGILYFKLEQFDWDGVCGGTWYRALRIPTSRQLVYNNYSQIVSCEKCTGTISVYTTSGELIEKIRAPMSTSSYRSGLYIALAENVDIENTPQNEIPYIRFIIP